MEFITSNFCFNKEHFGELVGLLNNHGKSATGSEMSNKSNIFEKFNDSTLNLFSKKQQNYNITDEAETKSFSIFKINNH